MTSDDIDISTELRAAPDFYNYFISGVADSVYGTIFFVATGFHGLHVIIGTTFLITCLLRQTTLHFSSNHYFGFEAAA
jgi:cytochrome c oxidase subunit 3